MLGPAFRHSTLISLITQGGLSLCFQSKSVLGCQVPGACSSNERLARAPCMSRCRCWRGASAGHLSSAPLNPFQRSGLWDVSSVRYATRCRGLRRNVSPVYTLYEKVTKCIGFELDLDLWYHRNTRTIQYLCSPHRSFGHLRRAI